MRPSQYPEACQAYARLSPDMYAHNHLKNYLDEHGSSLESYFNWLRFRLDTDTLPLVDLECHYDSSMFDNLNALG